MEKLFGAKGLLKNVVCLTETPTAYRRIEFQVDAPELPIGYNPFYEKDVAVEIRLWSSSSGQTIVMPGFYHQSYHYDAEGVQQGEKGEPCFRLRVSVPIHGKWEYVITLKIRDVGEDSVRGSLLVAENEDKRGFIRVEPNRAQNFMFDNGSPYVAIGQNIAWAFPVSPVNSHSRYFIDLLKKCAAEKANFVRIWSCSFALYLQSKKLDPAYMNLPDADQFDRIIEACEELGIYVDFTLYHHGQLSKRPGLPEHDYHNCAFNADNAGYLEDPKDFFTNKRAKRDAKIYMRYLVARYGYSTNIMCWEFFNEQDICDAGTSAGGSYDTMVEWHQEMCDYFREVDPYKHMLTTSSACYSDRVPRHEMFDFMSLHVYNYQSLELLADLQKNDYRTFHRPLLFGEMGMNGGPGYAGRSCGDDKLEIHQQNWMGLMGGGAGAATNWFWVGTEATNAYDQFRAVAEMAERIPWRDANLKMCDKLTVPTNHLKVLSQGYQLENSAWLWFYDTEYCHQNREVIAVREQVTFTVELADGEYEITYIDPWSGDVVATETAVSQANVLTVTMPNWQKDMAVTVLPK